MTHPHRPTRTVPAAKVHEWLAWFAEHSALAPHNTEYRRLRNRLEDFCRRDGTAGVPHVRQRTSTAMNGQLGSAPSPGGSQDELAFVPRAGFGSKSIERLITRVVIVTGIDE
jgi:hypothetical protein